MVSIFINDDNESENLENSNFYLDFITIVQFYKVKDFVLCRNSFWLHSLLLLLSALMWAICQLHITTHNQAQASTQLQFQHQLQLQLHCQLQLQLQFNNNTFQWVKFAIFW